MSNHPMGIPGPGCTTIHSFLSAILGAVADLFTVVLYKCCFIKGTLPNDWFRFRAWTCRSTFVVKRLADYPQVAPPHSGRGRSGNIHSLEAEHLPARQKSECDNGREPADAIVEKADVFKLIKGVVDFSVGGVFALCFLQGRFGFRPSPACVPVRQPPQSQKARRENDIHCAEALVGDEKESNYDPRLCLGQL